MIPTIIHLIAILIANKATWKFLGPYYGQYISDQILMGARFWFVLLGLLLIPFKQIKKVHLFTMITILIMFQPIYAHLVRHSSKEWGPSIGPVLSSIPMELAIMLSTYCIYKAFRGLGVPIILSLIPTILNVFFVNIELPVWTFSCGSFGLAAAITCLAGIVECARRATKSKLITFFIIMSLFNIFFAPFMGLLGIGQCTSIMTHSHLKHLNENTTVLARKESISGFISVVDLESEYGLLRLLRCDHSILGGTFHKFNNNSIYAAFYVLDFVRFVKRETQPKKLRALQIGLGVGISTKILIDNKVDVDVVELDPVVVQFTKDYFQLPEPKRLFIEDGRKFINEQTEIGVYDYVIHDVFSGGRVPASLFSIEAFKKIKTLLKPDGILALIFVGTPVSYVTRALVTTLEEVFSNVRYYLEMGDDSVQNIVLYATSYGDEIEFDFEQVPIPYIAGYRGELKVFTDRLMSVPNVTKTPVISDENNPLESLQLQSAQEHWGMIRGVFPNQHFWSDAF